MQNFQQQPKQYSDKQNQLVTAATPLLTLITQIRHTADHRNVAKLHKQIIVEIRNFEQKLRAVEYSAKLIVAARYCLCTAIDEAVLSRPWGTNSVWVQQSLLSLFHNETWGGERFYIIIENMAKDPRKNIEFLEFAYFLLSLGFEGKFFGKHITVREEIRNRILHRIRYSREKPDKSLSRHWQNRIPVTEQQHKKSSLKRIGYITIAIIAVIGIYYNLAVHSAAKPVFNKLNAIATVSPITTFGEVIQRQVIQRGIN